MASVSADPNSGIYYIRFRYGNRNVNRSLGTTSKQKAIAVKVGSEERLDLLERGVITIEPGVDPIQFIVANIKSENCQKRAPSSVRELFDWYFKEIPKTAKEESTFKGEKRHRQHLLKHIGQRVVPQFLTSADLQQYVEKRSNDNYRGKPIAPGTIGKELTTFKLIWNWAVRSGYLAGECPVKGVALPKSNAKPRFMTREEIETKIARGGLNEPQIAMLWNSLFLTVAEIQCMLLSVTSKATRNFVIPMIYFVAYTGARRSEMLRSRIDDFSLENRVVAIREKKKDQSKKMTLRHVSMCEALCEVMKTWLENHPGGQYTFCEDPSEIPLGLDEDQQGMSQYKAHYHFSKTLGQTDWGCVRGFHVLRHSFASNLAAAGLDQRMIDDWMGHQTEAMRRRYRHMFPQQQKSAIDLVF